MDRTGFIGGSDLYTIMSGDWYELWQVKTGAIPAPDLSSQFNVQLGTFTEQFNIQWLERVSGYQSVKQNPIHNPDIVFEKQLEIAGIPYKGQLDDVMLFNDEQYLCEAKHTSSYRTMSAMLGTYMPQMQMYMRIFGIHKCLFTVIFGNKHEWCIVEYDEDYWKHVHQQVFEFWQFVNDGIAPPTNSATQIDWSQVKIDGLKSRDASQDNHFVDLAHEYMNSLNGYKHHEMCKKELKAMVNTDEREVFCDLLSIRRDKRGSLRINVSEGMA